MKKKWKENNENGKNEKNEKMIKHIINNLELIKNRKGRGKHYIWRKIYRVSENQRNIYIRLEGKTSERRGK